MNSTLRPRSMRDERITVQQVGEETLLYDERTHRAWCLNASSACVWRLCDGQTTVAQIAAGAAAELRAPFSEELVLLTLAELREQGLLQSDPGDALPQGVTRRAIIGRIGLTAAALLPVIAALTAPPASAQGGSVGSGGNG
ncbi:MAG: PqqD family peptide modification chaperone [Acidobacteriota bacterium]